MLHSLQFFKVGGFRDIKPSLFLSQSLFVALQL
jgi:hypothetical protein